jgi:hypothetical protein
VQYIIDRDFKLVNKWQERKQGFRSVEYVLGEGRRILPLQGQKGQLVNKREFMRLMHSIPGLEFCLSSMSPPSQENNLTQPKLMVYVEFRQYAAINLVEKKGPVLPDSEYRLQNERARRFYSERKNQK